MHFSSTTLLTIFLITLAICGRSQDNSCFNTSSLGPEFEDYSNFKDTVLVFYGNCAPGGIAFEESTNQPVLMNFARKELTIRNGKLKKVMVFDSNSGYRTTTHYGPWNSVWTRRKYVMATNAPHPDL